MWCEVCFIRSKFVIDKTQIGIKLDDNDKRTLNYRLEELKNDLISEFDLCDVYGARWERKRDNFLQKIEEIAEKKAKKEYRKKLL